MARSFVLVTVTLLLLLIELSLSTPIPSHNDDLRAPTAGAAKHDRSYLVVEEFRPLSAAYNQNDRARAHAIKSRPVEKPTSIDVLVDLPTSSDLDDVDADINTPRSLSGARQLGRTSHFQLPIEKGPLVFDPMKHTTESHWLDWTQWSGCLGSERVRIRHCLEVNNVKCEGSGLETQKCYTFKNANLPFARDPLIIEKEINGPHEQ